MFHHQIRALELELSADFALLTKWVSQRDEYWKLVYGMMDWESWMVFFREFLLEGEAVFSVEPPIEVFLSKVLHCQQ